MLRGNTATAPAAVQPLVVQPVGAPRLEAAPDRRVERRGAARGMEQLDRAVNVTIAVVAIALLSPILLLVALVVKLSSPGPIIYRQIRVGLDRRRDRVTAMYERRGTDLGGRVFTIYKFRSMTLDSERDGIKWASKNDARVTAVGRVLRMTRIDELPQLFNVLKGDMKIVGPRPERPSIFVKLREQIADYPLRQRALPGITGWAQINQSYDSTVDDVRRKVEFDLAYIERQGIAEDIRIMLRTLPVMIFKRGAH